MMGPIPLVHMGGDGAPNPQPTQLEKAASSGRMDVYHLWHVWKTVLMKCLGPPPEGGAGEKALQKILRLV